MRKKSLILIVFICLLSMSSCITTKSTPKQDFIATVELDESFNKVAPMSYSDDLFDIDFQMNRYELAFRLKNKTNEPVYINWDLSSLSINGKSLRVIHNGIVLKDRDKPQALTSVPPYSIIEDALTPSENIDYYPGFYSGYYNISAGWIYKDFIKTTCNKKDSITEELILSQKGMKFSILLSFEYMGQKRHRIFNFTVTDIEKL